MPSGVPPPAATCAAVMCHNVGTNESVMKTSPFFVTTRSLSMPAPKLSNEATSASGRDVVDRDRAGETAGHVQLPLEHLHAGRFFAGSARNELRHHPIVERSPIDGAASTAPSPVAPTKKAPLSLSKAIPSGLPYVDGSRV